MNNFQKCKFGFLQQAFVPYLKKEFETGKVEFYEAELEKAAELFATMSMRILDKPDISEPANTAFNTEQPPLDVYYDEV